MPPCRQARSQDPTHSVRRAPQAPRAPGLTRRLWDLDSKHTRAGSIGSVYRTGAGRSAEGKTAGRDGTLTLGARGPARRPWLRTSERTVDVRRGGRPRGTRAAAPAQSMALLARLWGGLLRNAFSCPLYTELARPLEYPVQYITVVWSTALHPTSATALSRKCDLGDTRELSRLCGLRLVPQRLTARPRVRRPATQAPTPATRRPFRVPTPAPHGKQAPPKHGHLV